jgi:hypothetical protein
MNVDIVNLTKLVFLGLFAQGLWQTAFFFLDSPICLRRTEIHESDLTIVAPIWPDPNKGEKNHFHKSLSRGLMHRLAATLRTMVDRLGKNVFQ